MFIVVDICECGLSFGAGRVFLWPAVSLMVSSGFRLGHFGRGAPAAHRVESRLRPNVSARAFTHVFVCMLSVSSMLMVTPHLRGGVCCVGVGVIYLHSIIVCPVFCSVLSTWYVSETSMCVLPLLQG